MSLLFLSESLALKPLQSRTEVIIKQMHWAGTAGEQLNKYLFLQGWIAWECQQQQQQKVQNWEGGWRMGMGMGGKQGEENIKDFEILN